MKKLTRNGPLDSAGIEVYTVPVGETATINSFNVFNSKNATTITVKHFINMTGVTDTLYTLGMQPTDTFLDTGPYVLAEGDHFIIESTACGATYTAYIDIP
jgi:hypothetical protein